MNKKFWHIKKVIQLSPEKKNQLWMWIESKINSFEKNVRINDVAVFKFKSASGGHVGFIRDVDLENNKVKIAGGNQGNKFKETEYLIDSSDMYLLTVRRNWPDPGVAHKLPGAP